MRLSVDVSVTCGRTTPLAGQDRLRRLPPVFTSDFLEVCPPLLIFAGIDRNGNGTMVPRLFRGRLALWCYRMIGVNRYHQKETSSQALSRSLSPDGSEPERAHTSSAWL